MTTFRLNKIGKMTKNSQLW